MPCDAFPSSADPGSMADTHTLNVPLPARHDRFPHVFTAPVVSDSLLPLSSCRLKHSAGGKSKNTRTRSNVLGQHRVKNTKMPHRSKSGMRCAQGAMATTHGPLSFESTLFIAAALHHCSQPCIHAFGHATRMGTVSMFTFRRLKFNTLPPYFSTVVANECHVWYCGLMVISGGCGPSPCCVQRISSC
jgi:hypothetical protein